MRARHFSSIRSTLPLATSIRRPVVRVGRLIDTHVSFHDFGRRQAGRRMSINGGAVAGRRRPPREFVLLWWCAQERQRIDATGLGSGSRARPSAWRTPSTEMSCA